LKVGATEQLNIATPVLSSQSPISRLLPIADVLLWFRQRERKKKKKKKKREREREKREKKERLKTLTLMSFALFRTVSLSRTIASSGSIVKRTMAAMRQEKDSMGVVDVPQDRQETPLCKTSL
jgi:hypothetical protein